MLAKPSRHAPAERAYSAALLRQIQALKGQELLREVLSAVPDLLLVLNAQRQVVFANHVLADHLGLSEADVVGLRHGEVLGCVNALNDSGGCGTTQACRTCGAVAAILAAVGGVGAEEEARLRLRSGESLDLRVRTHPVRVGRDSLVVMTLKDIADEKRRRVLERVFFHDVLNTAGGVRGLAGLIRESDPSQVEMITDMLESSASQLVDEIQAQRLLTSVEENDYALQPSLVPVERLVKEVVATYLPLAKTRGVELGTTVDLPRVELETDRTMLGRVLGNLVKNAVEACQQGMTVLVGGDVEEDVVEFWVHNPVAMSEAVRHQVFQRSFSTKGAGRGLGTYSVKLFTEGYLGGRVSFESDVDVGTIFRVTVPLASE